MHEKEEWALKEGTTKNKGYSETSNVICLCPACDED
jgi:hypothetical protein